MFKKRYLFLIIIFALFIISAVNAEDINHDLLDDNDQLAVTDELELAQSSQSISLTSDLDDNEISSYSTDSNLKTGENVIYFDASSGDNGDGSKSNPFKYVNQNTLNNYIISGNNLTAYFADGTYDLNTNFIINSPNVVFIGENRENVQFNSILSNRYDFEIIKNSNLKLVNISFNHVNILNHGTLEAYYSDFNNSESFSGDNAPVIYNMNGYGSSYGGVIVCDPIGNSCPYVYLQSCVFDNNRAYCGGAISLKNSTLVVNNTNFYNSKAERKGGAIYAINSNITGSYSNAYFSNANYGGVIYCERSTVDLKNAIVTDSQAYSFGGIIASKYSVINIEYSAFANYSSKTDAGGAIYNFVGRLYIEHSSFRGGTAEFGGAICNLNSLLYVDSSFFDDHSGASGGVIYNIYGELYIQNNTFSSSAAHAGGVLYNQLSDDSYLLNNNFIVFPTLQNSSCIFCDSCSKELFQLGNHYEDVYYVQLSLSTSINGEDVVVDSNILKYVLSNDGTYKEHYSQFNSVPDSNEYFSLNIYDSNHPGDSMVFANYGEEVGINFNFTRHYDRYVDHLFKLKVFNSLGTILNEFSFNMVYDSFSRFDVRYPYSFDSHMVREYVSSRLIVENDVVSSINTTYSDLSNIPSYYSSRDYGYVTSVKDQAEGGNCWAFAGVATLETCVKKITGIAYDYSEENVKNMMSSFSTVGLDLEPNYGGYDSMVMAYLTSWFGPTFDYMDVYDDSSSLSRGMHSFLHIQNIRFLPPRYNGAYDYLYKQAIMDYGAVAITFEWLDAGLHSVSLVGWNDNYNNYDSLGRYTKGAWIFKNSWGSDWGDGGFGYLSYGTTFASDEYDNWHAYTFIFNKDDNYAINQHPDFSGVTDYICSDTPITCSMIINGPSNHVAQISAFATYFKVPTKYTVEIYNTKNSFPVLHQEGYSDAGYYTIPFYKTVTMNSLNTFRFSITFENEDENYLPVCLAEELTRAHFYGEGNFFYSDGYETNADLLNLENYHEYLFSGTRRNTCQTPCIHLFTNDYDKKKVSIEVNEFDSVNVGENVDINITFTNVWSLDNDFADNVQSMEGTLVNININGKDYYALIHNGKASLRTSFDKPGDHIVIVKYVSNKISSDSEVFSFKVIGQETGTNKQDTVLSGGDVSSIYGGNENLLVTLRDANGNLISNAVVTFHINGKSTTVRTNSRGQASLPINLAPQTYIATVSYGGSGSYNGATAKLTVVIKKATPKITASKKTFKLKVKKKKYTITLKDNLGRAIKNAKVTIKIKNKTFKAKTNAKGKATFNLKLTKKGIYKATVKYTGNAYYNTVSKKVKITVKK